MLTYIIIAPSRSDPSTLGEPSHLRPPQYKKRKSQSSNQRPRKRQVIGRNPQPITPSDDDLSSESSEATEDDLATVTSPTAHTPPLPIVELMLPKSNISPQHNSLKSSTIVPTSSVPIAINNVEANVMPLDSISTTTAKDIEADSIPTNSTLPTTVVNMAAVVPPLMSDGIQLGHPISPIISAC